MSWIEEKYIGGLSARLGMFKRTSDGYNFRCFVCGDSQKSKTKARGFLLKKANSFGYYCHNCHASMPFGKMLESLDPTAFKEYLRERFIEKVAAGDTSRIKEPAADIGRFITPKFIKYTALADLQKISQLAVDHPAKRYVVSRQIPSKYHSKLFFAPKFKAWTNKLMPDKFDLSGDAVDEPRLVIPLIDKDGNLFGYQGRSFGPREPKYITIILDPTKPRVYGLDTLNLNNHVYVVEGPIDSMFVNNCLAMVGSHLDKTAVQIGLRPDTTTIVYDNEPRNKEIVSAIEKSIDRGYRVCIWPADLKHKDINDMVKAGMSQPQIHTMISDHTYQGLLAKMVMVEWKKV